MSEAAATDLAVREPHAPVPAPILSGEELEATWRISKALAASGMFKDAAQAEQAFAKILLGRDLGLSPTQAMTGIYLIEGRPEVGANLLAFFVKSREGYDYRVVENTNDRCVIDFYVPGIEVTDEERAAGQYRSTFSKDDVATAGLKDKHNHKHYPRNMMFARAMSNGVKWFCPEVMNGVPVYIEGEIPRPVDVVGGDTTTDPTSPNTIQNVYFVDEVRATIARARDLGHAGLSSVATAEMTLSRQPEQRVRDWLNMAKIELDAMDPEDAEVVDGEATPPVEAAATPEAAASAEEPGGEQPEEAEVVDEKTLDRDAEVAKAELLRRAEEQDAHAEVAESEGDQDRASEHRQEAQALREAAEAGGNPDQAALDL